MTTEKSLQQLDRLVGNWTTESRHPALLGLVVHGTVLVEWLEGKRFLIHRARFEHPEFPDSIGIIGNVERDRVEDGRTTTEARLEMHYFDSRGVFREYDVSADATGWRLERLAPGFSQRFLGAFSRDDETISGQWELSRDDVKWDDDLAITYRRKR